jgi:N-formylmaleamate deformylase
MKKLIFAICLLLRFTDLYAEPGFSFGVRISGKGKPMILIPGLKGSADTYNDVVAHYAAHYKCYVITLAGFAGQPPSGELDHPFREQRDEIISFIIKQHLHKPVLVGFSMGGALALWITTTRPDLIGKLIELDGVPFNAAIDNPQIKMDTVKASAKKWIAWDQSRKPGFWRRLDSIDRTPKVRADYIKEIGTMVSDTARMLQIRGWDDASDQKATLIMSDEESALDLRDSVHKVNCPVLVLGSWVGWDSLKTEAAVEARYLQQWRPAKNLTMVFSEHGKHFLMYDDFDWMIAEMDKFLIKKRND